MTEKELKKQENEEWLTLCKYVHDEILQYDSSLKFPRYLALRLRGLSSGQFMANKKQKPMASYDYKTILYTFKACKPKILQHMMANQTKFADEKHKINSIMIFVENDINDMVIRLQNAQKAKEKTEMIEIENFYNEGANYISKSKKENSNLNNLW